MRTAVGARLFNLAMHGSFHNPINLGAQRAHEHVVSAREPFS
jgi:hypothetical protein